MKGIFKGILFSVLSLFLFFTMQLPVKATDVWLYYSQYDQADVYLMDDTISYGVKNKNSWFNVSVKHVRDGQLIRKVKLEFAKYKDDFWRYHSDRMPPKYNPVTPSNIIFRYTMDRIGWSYYTVKKYGWEYVY